MAEPLKLVNGNLVVNVTDADGTVRATHAVDVLALKLACEECVDQHRLAVQENGTYKVTSDFLLALAARLGSFVPDCTPSMAYQLWVAADGQLEALKKNTQPPPNSPTGSESHPSN